MIGVTPSRPLTEVESDVARLLGQGRSYLDIAKVLHMSPRTVEVYVARIAELIPNPDQLRPGTHVMLWAAHELWRERMLQSA